MLAGSSRPPCPQSSGETSSTRAVVLFCRDPQAEARAKRLPLRTARLFRRILWDWRTRAREAGARLVLVTPPECLSRLRGEAPEALVAAQPPGPFADRLDAAVEVARQSGTASVVIAPGDTPPLPLGDLLVAFARLEEDPEALVIAPAEDGGVNAIGLSRPSAGLLHRIEWMTERVGAQLTAEAIRFGLRVVELSAAPDLDSAADLHALAVVARWHPAWRPYCAIVGILASAAPAGDTGAVVCEPGWIEGPADPRGPPLRMSA
ncbi:MAG: DUF2064 domain-containing protein [Acidobacteriota bacterium]